MENTRKLYARYRREDIPKQFPSITEPKVIGYFSVDSDANYINSVQNLKYLYKPHLLKRNLDLNEGYNISIKKITDEDHIFDRMLKFILDNKLKLKNSIENQAILKYDFISFRGLLRLVMCTPYEFKDDWCILATKFRGNIYLCQKRTEKKAFEKANRSDVMKKILFYGFKFEQFMLTDEPNKEPDTSVALNENEEFCCVFGTRLGDERLLYGAEMDGVESDEIFDATNPDAWVSKFIELKVKLAEKHYRQKLNLLKYKLRNWWCQCFLVNVKSVYVGTRNEVGILQNIEKLYVKDFPKLAENNWLPNVCVDFLSKFLNFVKTTLSDTDSPDTVHEFYYNPQENQIIHKTHNNNINLNFLPDWYIKEIITNK